MDGLTLSDFYAAWDIFGVPALTGAIIGLVLGLLGVYVVLRRLVFLSAAVSQAASLGVALAFFAAIHLGAEHWYVPSPSVGALLVTFLATLVVAGRRGRSTAWRDAALGLVFLLGAAGTLALGSRIVQELSDIDSLLFGSAVAVLPEDFEVVAWVFGAVLVVHVLWWRGFAAVSFDLPGALVRRIPTRLLELLLFATLALVISLGTRVIGALPVFALSVLPAVVGARLATHLPMALGASAAVGAVAGFYGYLLAFLHDLPVGAAQTLIMVAFVLLGEAVRRVPVLPIRLAPGAAGPPPARVQLAVRVGAWVTG
ncbi:MAG: metal ABC transporter permease, partial [Deltaproteobacteria bacterium]